MRNHLNCCKVVQLLLSSDNIKLIINPSKTYMIKKKIIKIDQLKKINEQRKHRHKGHKKTNYI